MGRKAHFPHRTLPRKARDQPPLSDRSARSPAPH